MELVTARSESWHLLPALSFLSTRLPKISAPVCLCPPQPTPCAPSFCLCGPCPFLICMDSTHLPASPPLAMQPTLCLFSAFCACAASPVLLFCTFPFATLYLYSAWPTLILPSGSPTFYTPAHGLHTIHTHSIAAYLGRSIFSCCDFSVGTVGRQVLCLIYSCLLLIFSVSMHISLFLSSSSSHLPSRRKGWIYLFDSFFFLHFARARAFCFLFMALRDAAHPPLSISLTCPTSLFLCLL